MRSRAGPNRGGATGGFAARISSRGLSHFCSKTKKAYSAWMDQATLRGVMTSLAEDGSVLPPEEALQFIAEYLERMRLTMDQTDYEGLLYTGALIVQLASREAP